MPGVFSKCPIEVRQIQNGYVSEPEDTVARNGALAGNDIEKGSVEGPPRFWDFAIGDEAFVEYQAGLDAIGPLAFVIEGIAGGEQSRPSHDLGWRGAAHHVKLSSSVLRLYSAWLAFRISPVA